MHRRAQPDRVQRAHPPAAAARNTGPAVRPPHRRSAATPRASLSGSQTSSWSANATTRPRGARRSRLMKLAVMPIRPALSLRSTTRPAPAEPAKPRIISAYRRRAVVAPVDLPFGCDWARKLSSCSRQIGRAVPGRQQDGDGGLAVHAYQRGHRGRRSAGTRRPPRQARFPGRQAHAERRGQPAAIQPRIGRAARRRRPVGVAIASTGGAGQPCWRGSAKIAAAKPCQLVSPGPAA